MPAFLSTLEAANLRLPRMPTVPYRTGMCSDAEAETNFGHVGDVEMSGGVDDVERHTRYLGHVALSVAYRNAADTHIHRRYRLHLVHVVALDQLIHETGTRQQTFHLLANYGVSRIFHLGWGDKTEGPKAESGMFLGRGQQPYLHQIGRAQ